MKQQEQRNDFTSRLIQKHIHPGMHVLDIELNGYKTRTMRIRSFKADPVKNSQRTPNTNGLWEISFNLEEF